MVGGGGNRKDDSVVLKSTNVFAALDTLRKKKKSEKSKQGSSKPNSKQVEAQKEVFWAPAPLTVKSWADVDDDDDDDYYATTAPPVSTWGATPETNHANEALEVSESEEEGLDEVDDDIEEEHENDDKLEASVALEPVIKKPSEASSSNKEPERQLSKKELKKKGLEELDAVLAELGYAKQDTGVQDDSHGAKEEKAESSVDVEKKESVPGESKSSKKKKKKEKMLKEDKESEDQPQGADLGHGTSEAAETEKADDASAVDVKARLKKVATTKKKKSSKEIDAAARAAAVEAAARRAKLAAAKKKEKTHYNQQPVR